MGFFKDIGRAIGRGVGSVIERAGDFFESEGLKKIGRSIQETCAEKVASEKSYDKKEANIYTTDRLNEVLVAFSEGYFQQATIYENSCIRLVEDYYETLIGLIENVSGNAHSAANIRALKNEKGRIARTISGGITKPLAKRMSLDDSECLRILKMDSGVEKKQAMTDFTKKVIKESLNNLAKNVRETLTEQTKDIQDYLNSISEEQEKAMWELKERFDKMVKDNEMEQSDKENNCIIPLLLINVSDCVVDILR